MKSLKEIFRSKLASQFATFLSGRVIAALIQAASLYFLAKWSDITSFGILISALGAATAIQALAAGGINMYLVKEVARNGISAKTNYAAALSKLFVTTSAIIFMIAILLLAKTFHPTFFMLAPVPLWLFFDRLNEVKLAIARGLGDIRLCSTNLVLRRTLQIAIFTLLATHLVAAEWAYTISLPVSSLTTYVLMYSALPRTRRSKLSFRKAKCILSNSSQFWINSTAMQLRNMDTAIVGLIGGPTEASLYGIGARLMNPLRMVPNSMAAVLIPHVARNYDQTIKSRALAIALGSTLSIPYAIIFLAAPSIVSSLGSEYFSALINIRILCIGLIASSFVSILNSVLIATDEGTLVARSSIIATAIYLILIGAGAIFAGSLGAAIGFAFSMLANALILNRYLKNHA